MSERRKYQKDQDATVTAVQLDLDTEGFTYHKWDGVQTCRAGDWIVNNDGDTYTIARDTFEKTYEFVSPGVYTKTTCVWAQPADAAGKVKTKEGETSYQAGDYLVFNNEDGSDAYAVARETFEKMYTPVD